VYLLLELICGVQEELLVEEIVMELMEEMEVVQDL
jgi:hypothetical protein